MGMIKVIGGTLYQWGIGRKVKVIPHNDKSVCEVHFAHQSDTNALVVIPTIENGEICAEIPNILLQSTEPICVYAIQKDDVTEKCFCNCTLFVRYRPKPEDYVYTETERLNFDFLAAKIKEFETIIANIKDGFSPIANVLQTDTGAIVSIQDQAGTTEATISHGKKGDPGKSAYEYAKESGYTGTDEEFAAKMSMESPTMEQFEQISAEISDLKYVKIDITKFSNNIGTVEIGYVINTVTVSWELNKEAENQILEGEALEISARSKVLNGLEISANKSFTLTVTDERGATDSASTSISFLNGVYYGVLESGADIDSSKILAMTKRLQGSRGINFTVNAGASQKIAYALPTRYGTPNFNVGGFDGGFSLAKTFSFTNASGYTESYAVWLSDNVGLGSTTVSVS